MAKIKFGDYLKSKKQKEAVYESDESIAKRVEDLIESDSCAVQPRFRVDNYRKALDLLAQIPDYPAAAELTRICQEKLDEAREAVICADHQIAKYHLETASTEYEFRKASDELTSVCEELKSWQNMSGSESYHSAVGDSSHSSEGNSLSVQEKAGSAAERTSSSKEKAGSAAESTSLSKEKAGSAAESTSSSKENAGSAAESTSPLHEKADSVAECTPPVQEKPDWNGMLREAEALKAQADAQIVRYSARTTRHRWTALIILVVAVAAVLYAWFSGYAWYLAAKLEGMGGIYKSAYSRFYKLGDYLDSREQYEYYKEKYLRQREHEESQALPDADVGDTVEFSGFSWLVLRKEGTKLQMICTAPEEESAFSHVTYDGPTKVLREEMDIEPETIDGHESADGPENTGLQKSTGKAEGADGKESTDKPVTESRQKAGGGQKEETTPETEGGQGAEGTRFEGGTASGSASWKDSSLRAYLNETVLAHEFTEAEIAAMELQISGPTSNPRYEGESEEEVEDNSASLKADLAQNNPAQDAQEEDVEGKSASLKADLAQDNPAQDAPAQNNPTQVRSEESVEDKISILSVEQAQELLEEGVFKTPSVDMWMRTPGADMHSAVYLTSKGNVILYGNDVTDDSLSVCPLITVDYAKLEK